MSTSNPLAEELVPTVEQLFDRHLEQTTEWMPHDFVPWSRGKDFTPGEQWDPKIANLPPAVCSALFVNLLTEDNLPYYTHSIMSLFGPDSAWRQWARHWTAEEGRHSIVIRDYVIVTRAIDPVLLERARMAQVMGGIVPDPPTVAEGLVYVALQELATRVSHVNTGRLLPDPIGTKIMARVGGDENFHHMFYRDVVTTAFEIAPSEMMRAAAAQIQSFAMPGVGIPGFNEHARVIEQAGIYNLDIHANKILGPMVEYWGLAEMTGLDSSAEQARDEIFTYLRKLGRAVEWKDSHRTDAETKADATV